MFATACHKKKYVKRLKDDQGGLIDNGDQIEGLSLDYFSNIFTAEFSHPVTDNVPKVQHRVTEDMNLALNVVYTRQEVKKVL